MSRPTVARACALGACAFFAMLLAVGAGAPARTAPPTIWARPAAAKAHVAPAPARWPRRPRERFAMRTPGGDRAIRAIVADAARDLRTGRDPDVVVDDVRAQYQRAASAHLEAYDGVVRRALAAELDRYLAAVGYERIDLGLLSNLAG